MGRRSARQVVFPPSHIACRMYGLGSRGGSESLIPILAIYIESAGILRR